MPHLKPISIWLPHALSQVSPDNLEQIERYVVLLYQGKSALSSENEGRKQLLTLNHKMENIPPMLHSLEQHEKRHIYQEGHNWGSNL